MGHNQNSMSYLPWRRRPRIVKFILVAAILTGFTIVWERGDLTDSVSRYLPIPLDTTEAVLSANESAKNEIHPSHREDLEGEGSRNDKHEDSNPPSSYTFENSTPALQPTEQPAPKPSPSSQPRFGKVTASFGDPDPPYEAAIASHRLHNDLHGYPHFILREHMIRGLWSKHGWIMTIIGQELAKPEGQRLQWLLWHDRDTVVMNAQIPLDIFVPPEPEFGHIHLLVTRDKNGLNNGVFLVRVSQWAFKLFASALSIREYQPDLELKYTEQSGMEEAIIRPWWASSVAYVPQRWFNGFPPSDDPKDGAAGRRKASVSRPGSLLIHFASNRDGLRPERMARWGEVATARAPEWDKPVNETGYLGEIAEYWERLGKGESMEEIVKGLGTRSWD